MATQDLKQMWHPLILVFHYPFLLSDHLLNMINSTSAGSFMCFHYSQSHVSLQEPPNAPFCSLVYCTVLGEKWELIMCFWVLNEILMSKVWLFSFKNKLTLRGSLNILTESSLHWSVSIVRTSAVMGQMGKEIVTFLSFSKQIWWCDVLYLKEVNVLSVLYFVFRVSMDHQAPGF